MGFIKDAFHLEHDYSLMEFLNLTLVYAYKISIGGFKDRILMRHAIGALKERLSKLPKGDTESLVDFCFGFDYYGIRINPEQKKSEVIQLLDILKVRMPKRMLEIGTASGGTLFVFSQVLGGEAHIISLDLPFKELRVGYPPWRRELYKSFAKDGQRIDLLQANSHTKEALESVKKALAGEKLDFLFIDGDHSYEGAKADYKMYAPLVRRGGMVAFHDVVKWPGRKQNPVRRAWIGARANCKGWKEISHKKGLGIGIIYV